MLSIAFGLFCLYLDCVDYIWIVLIVCRPTALYRRQAGVQECIKGYTWSVWSKVELCRVQIAHQSCWLSWNCVDHRDFAKHQTCLIPFDILLILEKRAMPYFHTSDTDTIVGPDPPNPMVNWYSWHRVGTQGVWACRTFKRLLLDEIGGTRGYYYPDPLVCQLCAKNISWPLG